MDPQFQKDLIATLLGIIPPGLVGLVFYIIMRSILRADSKERKVWNQIEAEERLKAGMPAKAEKAKPDSAQAK
ncbi:MAG: hypothetical protein RLZZ603_34 [Actinomycetota bacterium]|jgi:hypothetical protein